MVPMPAETCFLDTNILLTATDESRDHHGAARRLIASGLAGGERMATSGQVLREYLVVATRPVDRNGLGLPVAAALANVEQFTRRLMFCDETEAVSKRLRELVRAHRIEGKAVHDANIVATMSARGIRVLVTGNPDDFARFPEVRTVTLE